MEKNVKFKVGDYCVYNTHGVVMVKEIQTIKMKDFESRCFVLFLKDGGLTLIVPEDKAESMGVRKLSSKVEMNKVFNDILSSGVRKLKGMWSRRAKEYEEKINSGDISMIAEVIRDLTRDIEESDRSFSERMIYESAVDRLSSEYAAVENITIEEAKDRIVKISKQKVQLLNIQQDEILETKRA
jgi:CarD family transcriptional regulator